jgi:glucan 1,3-beta-glucosidase
LHISNTPVGIDTTNGDGSIVVIDSDFTNTPIAIRTQFGGGPGAAGSLYVENVNYAGSGTIVQSSGNNVLTTTSSKTVKSWAQGYLWQNGGNTMGTIDLSSQTPTRPASLLKADGTYFEQTRPTFVGIPQIDVTTLGLVGDGVTDNTAALQNALNAHTGSVLLFPYGTYIISNTVTVPSGSRMLGQVAPIVLFFFFFFLVHFLFIYLFYQLLGLDNFDGFWIGIPKRKQPNSNASNRLVRSNWPRAAR